MMTMLFVQRGIRGKTAFGQVPTKLQEDVAAILVPELVPTAFGGTAQEKAMKKVTGRSRKETPSQKIVSWGTKS